MISYMGLLRAISLNLAQGLAAGQFIAVIIGANRLLGEPISLLRWAAIALIAAGIFVLGASAEA